VAGKTTLLVVQWQNFIEMFCFHLFPCSIFMQDTPRVKVRVNVNIRLSIR